LASVTLPIAAAHVELATNAVIWLQRFYASVEAQLADSSVELSSSSLAAPQLEHVWQAALVNELSYVENMARRRELLNQLVR
jgi:hypothetical protein